MKSEKTAWSRIGLLVLLLVNTACSAELKGTVTALRGSDVKVNYVQEGKVAPAQGDRVTFSEVIPGADSMVGSGTGIVKEVGDSFVWVEVVTKSPQLDHVAVIEATGVIAARKAHSPRNSLSADQVSPNNSGKMKVGWLGTQVRRATLERGGTTGSSYGILIDAMEADSPAKKAGLLKGDIILEINGKSLRSIRSIHTYFHIIGSQKPGSPVQLEVLRKGKRFSETITLGERLVPNGYLKYRLSKLYQYGDQVAYDHAETNRLLQQAADAGYTRAQYELGFAYANGLLRLKRDGKSAAKYYLLAADQGDAGAQFELASLYYKGWGVEKDLRMALRYFRLAADQGNKYGQYYLGQMYETGHEVAKDNKEAINWYRKAAAQKYKPAIKDLKRLEQ